MTGVLLYGTPPSPSQQPCQGNDPPLHWSPVILACLSLSVHSLRGRTDTFDVDPGDGCKNPLV